MENKEVVVKQGLKLAKEAKSTQDKVRQAVDKNQIATDSFYKTFVMLAEQMLVLSGML